MSNYSQDIIDKVWNKGIIVPSKDPRFYRKDKNGNLLYYQSYGLYTEMGWNIDHIVPVNLGGSDDLSNLQPLKSVDNSSKGDRHIG